MLLKNLINKKIKFFEKIKINDLVLDSRKVKKGNIFFALKGTKLDGRKYIQEAIKKGARAIVCSKKINIKNKKVCFIEVKDVRKELIYSCKKFFKLKPKNIFAVTGTNGKTSVAEFFYQILSLNNVPVASIGTLGVKKEKKIKKLNLTSPDIISLHRELEKIKLKKIDNVIIEASSHGLHQRRLEGIKFKAGIFTNLSQDHLDYHRSMKNYLNAKMILFTKLLSEKKYIITDDRLNVFSKIKKISQSRKLKIFTINKILEKIENKNLNLLGRFQLKNLSMSILAASLCGIKISKMLSNINKINNVEGRLELVRTLPNQVKIFVDYAHTPEALKEALISLKSYYNNVTLVFGCGGERDIKKRGLMANIADKFCKKVFVTDDNPRNENPQKIRRKIIQNLKKVNYAEIGNRKKAISEAIKNAEPFDVILVAGKGHETYQDYGKKILNISDKKIIKKYITKISNIKKKDFVYYENSKILNKILNYNKFFKTKGVSINSKKIKKDNLFIALKGKKKDGHNFISNALKNGASHCIISKKINKIKEDKILNVKNTFNFLNDFASYKRNLSKAKIIAVTGSAGKTTLKTMLAKILSNYNKTYFSPKSYNNHYGVPVSLSNLENAFQFGIFEIGMSKKGEINKLSKLTRPHIAVITNVAEAHIENFKNLQGVAEAKSEIIYNIEKKGTIILNRDDKFYNYFRNIAINRKLKIISFGLTNKSDIFLVQEKKYSNYKLLKIKVLNKIVNLKINNINTYNILASLAVLKSLNLDLEKSIKTFDKLKPIDGRGKIYDIIRYNKKFNLVDESYNANPLSVKNAIFNLNNIDKKFSKKYLLLGDMLELGKKSNFYHKELSNIINNSDIDKLFIYGDKIFNTYKNTDKKKQGNILQHLNDFDEVFSHMIEKNDYLMIKGSNSTELSKISNSIIKGRKNVV